MTDTLTGTVTFARKVQPKQYESGEAGHFVQYDFDPNSSDEAIIAAAKRAFSIAKTTVLDELGLSYTYDEFGTVREAGLPATQVVANLFPGATVEPQAAAAAPPAQPPATPAAAVAGDVPPNPPANTGNKDADRAAIRAWGVARYNAHPDEFYDNRPKKTDGSYKPTAPDLKHKTTQTGIWL